MNQKTILNIKLLSDLHLEFHPFTITYDGEDVLILAGDISPSIADVTQMIADYLSRAKETHVILVLGNHDYYGNTIENVIKSWRDVNLDRFHFLHDNSVVIQDVRFFGTTMWTDMNKGHADVKRFCARYVNDFYYIKNFTPEDAYMVHATSTEILRETLNESKERVVVITHHLPSYKNIDPTFDGHSANPSFASTDLDNLINHSNVIMWCHGHTHRTIDYIDRGTRVVCNPRGYMKLVRGKMKKENIEFDETMVLQMTLDNTPSR